MNLLADSEGARNAGVHALVGISLKRIPRLDAHSVIVPKNVAVRIETRKLSEVVRSLQAHNGAKLPTVDNHIHVCRSVKCRVANKTVGDIVGRNCALAIEAAAILGNEHEARIRAIIDTLGPCVAESKA